MNIFKIVTTENSRPYYIHCNLIEEAMKHALDSEKAFVDMKPLGCFSPPIHVMWVWDSSESIKRRVQSSDEEGRKQKEVIKNSIKIESAEIFHGTFIDLVKGDL